MILAINKIQKKNTVNNTVIKGIQKKYKYHKFGNHGGFCFTGRLYNIILFKNYVQKIILILFSKICICIYYFIQEN